MNFIKRIITAWRNANKKTKDAHLSSEAVKQADKLARETKRRQYVLKINDKYYVFNKSQIKTLKKRGILREDLDFLMLDKVAYYITH